MNQKPSPLHRASEWIVDHYRLFFVVFAALLVFSAVASGWVKVENDVAAYLPADSETRQENSTFFSQLIKVLSAHRDLLTFLLYNL